MTPQQFKMTLTGGATYDQILLPNTITRLCFKSLEGNDLLVKFNSTDGDPLTVKAGTFWDSEFLDIISSLWQSPIVYVNGTGNIDGEYWR